jgi:hypothetical protein
MFTSHIVSRFRSFLLLILGIFRRALCCFSRRRKSSVSDFEQLSSVNVINDRPSHKRNVQVSRLFAYMENNLLIKNAFIVD